MAHKKLLMNSKKKRIMYLANVAGLMAVTSLSGVPIFYTTEPLDKILKRKLHKK
jgi:hypothetical protein